MRGGAEFGREVKRLCKSDDEQKEIESFNSARQLVHVSELVSQWGGVLQLTPQVIKDSHRIAVENIYADAGEYRDQFVSAGTHTPPKWRLVPGFVEELCEYANSHCSERESLDLAAYLLWRINWIHPFFDGNGRVSRAMSYLGLCVAVNLQLPGTKIVAFEIDNRAEEYYAALQAADREWARTGEVGTHQLKLLIQELLIEQLESANLDQ